ncbi:unnamed protein product [Ilex paraguariensis]|uniref:Phorbol-ester/DAG-type domain-containing protein n=1 Tax=Ilex paraguariensis TaxID=185542 RepID=A0ABC8RNL6_9AQUA
MELQHFSHEHPLIPMEVSKEKGGRVTCCAGCLKPILGAAYSCTIISEITDEECNFFLHKRCAELPDEIKNLLHQPHVLSLSKDKGCWDKPDQCDVCRKYCGDFNYGCNICTFRICLSCCLEESNVTITHESHHHPLTLLPMETSFYCNICGTEDKDFLYLCNTCQFCIHKSCAMLSNTAYSIEHRHPLTLVKRNRFKDLIFQRLDKCSICHEIFIRNTWAYKCDLCDYEFVAHVKCATAPSEQISLVTSENKPGEPLGIINLSLPPADGSTVLMRDLVEQNIIEQTGGETKITHWSHEQHPLILFNVQNSHEMMDDIILCNCCVQAISIPFYSCEECNYFLHLYCANLPRELRHPIIHPTHRLQLIYDNKFYHLHRCKACFSYTNGFFYKCCEDEGCDVCLDVRCAFMPSRIAHEAHEHPLFQIESRDIKCSGCASHLGGVKFKCNTCKFVICHGCAPLPRTIKHRWDPHPFTLTYPPFNDLADEFHCEFCEIEINQKLWMYHCCICDKSSHLICIYDVYSKVQFGSTVQVNEHPHPLMFVQKSKRGTCFKCGGDSGERIFFHRLFFQCQECDYAICNDCSKLEFKYYFCEEL